MAKQKHLVLDDDVHEILAQRKELTGSSIKDIGNSALRASMENVFVGDVVGKMLVEKGLISEKDLVHVLQEASAEVQRTQARLKVPVETTKKGTIISGSFETRQLFRRSDGAFQVLECWTRDSRGLPMGAHRHAADEYFIVMQGRILVTMTGIPYTLHPLNMFQVPANVVHSVKPLDPDCHFLTILVPAVPEYFGSNG